MPKTLKQEVDAQVRKLTQVMKARAIEKRRVENERLRAYRTARRTAKR